MTLVGATLRFERATWIATTGATGSADWKARRVGDGETVACGPCRGGARAYLCVRGGIDVPRVLGSASTHLATRLGGFAGRALRAGDRIALPEGEAGVAPLERALDPRAIPGYADAGPLRVVDGPQAGWFDSGTRERLQGLSWEVSEACDRMGIRLEGGALARLDAREPLTEGVALGAIQVASGGGPIVLFVDHQTTGGYPKIANVIAADLPRLGRLRPRDRVRFRRVELAAALRALREREEALVGILA